MIRCGISCHHYRGGTDTDVLSFFISAHSDVITVIVFVFWSLTLIVCFVWILRFKFLVYTCKFGTLIFVRWSFRFLP